MAAFPGLGNEQRILAFPGCYHRLPRDAEDQGHKMGEPLRYNARGEDCYEIDTGIMTRAS